MTIKVKVGDLYKCKPSLNMLGQIEVEAGPGLLLARLVKKVRAEIVTVDEIKNQLVYKHGKDNAGVFEVPPEKMAAYTAELDSIFNQEIEMKDVEKFFLPRGTKVKLGILVDWEPFIGVSDV